MMEMYSLSLEDLTENANQVKDAMIDLLRANCGGRWWFSWPTPPIRGPRGRF